ncbi:hypothetical protein J3R30DRAFT_3499809 [Lentinula aciculospora]|uniref:DUF6532 domain-containing protein n=1 Tax=Lentinula aciculospora TaxID=153920 RepID=A0A9W9DM31_9AGAR|nr:hypothetical protein J3R30DRAFT_3499809 [Lentinula aciculospora]
MPPQSANTLSSLLKSKVSPTKNMGNSSEKSSDTQRPSRETKAAALQNKVWMNDASQSAWAQHLKRSSESVPDTAKAMKKLKASQASNGKVHGGLKSQTPKENSSKASVTIKGSSRQKKKQIQDEDLDAGEGVEDEEEEPTAQNSDIEPEGNRDEDLEDKETEYALTETDLLAERAQSKSKGTGTGACPHAGRIDVIQSDSDNENEESASIPPPKTYSQLPGLDDGEYSDAPSSVMELSLIQGQTDNDEEAETNMKKKPGPKTAHRDAKYESERPTIAAPASNGPAKKKKVHSTATQSNPNDGWPVETHITYPDGTTGQRTISLHLQNMVICNILHEAIVLATGLTMFEEAFPTSEQQLSHSLTSLLSAANSLKHPQIAHCVENDDTYSHHLTNYVTGRVGKMQADVKGAAVDAVASMYGILQVPVENDARKRFVKTLMSKLNFIFPWNHILDANSIRRNEPYLHPAIISVLHKFFFKSSKSLGNRFGDTFVSTSKTDDTKKVPEAMLSLAVVTVFAALKEWEEGKTERQKQDFAATSFNETYTLHKATLLDKILKSKVGDGAQKYHMLMARLYREGKA